MTRRWRRSIPTGAGPRCGRRPTAPAGRWSSVRDALPDGGMQTGDADGAGIGADRLAEHRLLRGRRRADRVPAGARAPPPRWWSPTSRRRRTRSSRTRRSLGQARAGGGQLGAGDERDRLGHLRGAGGRAGQGPGPERPALPPAGGRARRGRARIRIVATDSAGQETLSGDGDAEGRRHPAVGDRPQHVAAAGCACCVHDGGSGARRARTAIAFGDRTPPVRGRVDTAHRYRAAGRYLITVRCADRAGNRAVDHILVAVR